MKEKFPVWGCEANEEAAPGEDEEHECVAHDSRRPDGKKDAPQSVVHPHSRGRELQPVGVRLDRRNADRGIVGPASVTAAATHNKVKWANWSTEYITESYTIDQASLALPHAGNIFICENSKPAYIYKLLARLCIIQRTQ